MMEPIAIMPNGMAPFRPEDDPYWKERLSGKPPEGYENWKLRLDKFKRKKPSWGGG